MSESILLERRFSQQRDLRLHVGRQIKALRQRRELTQKELAKKADVTPNTMRGLEKGTLNTRWANVVAVARVLQVTVEHLLEVNPAEQEYWRTANPGMQDLLGEDLQIARAYHHSNSDVRARVRALLDRREYPDAPPVETDGELQALLVRYHHLPSLKRRLVDELILLLEEGEHAIDLRRSAHRKS
jgi:DNA-binding XRE family transcriptional regulator